MTPGVVKIIKEQGSAIRCESELGEGGDHAGLIMLINEDKDRIILGRTDPTFKTAKAAVDAMKDTVDTIQNGKPAPHVETAVPASPVPPPEPEKAPEEKKPRKRKPKRKPRRKKE